MSSTIIIFLLTTVLVLGSCKEIENDNKAIESKSTPTIVHKDLERINKNEKRAPVVMTAVAGELKYSPETKYRHEMKYPVQPHIMSNIPDIFSDAQFLTSAPTSQSTKSHYIMYSPVPQPPTQMVLMYAVPHPSGQYLMLLPPQNVIYPMFYRSPPAPGPLSQIAPVTTIPSYQPPTYQQAAGFVAQHQLTYPGPYRSEKYTSSKQN